MDKKRLQIMREEILSAWLDQTPCPGWSWEAFEQAAEKSGHTKDRAFALFPGRLKDVLDALSAYYDARMLQALAARDPAALPVRTRIRTAILARFDVLDENPDHARAATRWTLAALRTSSAARLTWRSADKIWIWAGDTASDYNFYTKRALLSGILAASRLAWLDQTTSREKLEDFLDRRIENVMQLNKVIAPLKKKKA